MMAVLRRQAAPAVVRGAMTTIILLIAFSADHFSQTKTAPLDPAREAELIHYGDLIDIDFVGNLEYDWRGSVNPEGFLEGLVLANEPVYALCRSGADVAADIAAQYSRVLKEPKIEVRILDRNGRAATLLMGAVRNQQRFKLVREVRLSELLALSGGITDAASGKITIFRPPDLNCFGNAPTPGPGRSPVTEISLSKLLSGDPAANPVVLSGDVITVVAAPPIYVVGGVNSPRQLSSREETSLSRAIAAAGGLSKDAVESDITVYRRDGKGSRTMSFDLKKILQKAQDDPILRPYDVIEVAQKGRARSKMPPVIDAPTLSRDIFKTPVRIID